MPQSITGMARVRNYRCAGRPSLARPSRTVRLAWTRLHGVLSLELGGHLAATGMDPALLYQAEVDLLAG
jgi:hypothetical protein